MDASDVSDVSFVETFTFVQTLNVQKNICS